MELSQNQIAILNHLIDQVLNSLYDRDLYLIQNKVNERTIVSTFSTYFQELLEDTEFIEYNLDIEYNRNYSDTKSTVNFPNGTYPDLILHRRGSNDYNICIFEFKTWWNENTGNDILKLKDFTRQSDNYRYGVGYSILLNQNRQAVQRIVIKNSEVIND